MSFVGAAIVDRLASLQNGTTSSDTVHQVLRPCDARHGSTKQKRDDQSSLPTPYIACFSRCDLRCLHCSKTAREDSCALSQWFAGSKCPEMWIWLTLDTVRKLSYRTEFKLIFMHKERLREARPRGFPTVSRVSQNHFSGHLLFSLNSHDSCLFARKLYSQVRSYTFLAL